MRTIVRLSLVPAALIVATAAAGSDFDGSSPLLCAPASFQECTITGCVAVAPESINAPRFITVDVRKKKIERTGYAEIPASRVDHIESVDGKLIVQGVEDGIEGVSDGLGYSIAVNEETGEMVFSASADGAAFVAIGTCLPR